MAITNNIVVTHLLVSSTVSDDGSLVNTFTIDVPGITTFNKSLIIPYADMAPILDATITDGKSIREAMTERVYNYFLGNGMIVGTIVA